MIMPPRATANAMSRTVAMSGDMPRLAKIRVPPRAIVKIFLPRIYKYCVENLYEERLCVKLWLLTEKSSKNEE
jgi:hypothetical protein